MASEPPISDNSDTEGNFLTRTCEQQIVLVSNLILWLLIFTAFENDARYLSAEEQNRELTRSISREVVKLSEQWNNLIDHSDNWKHSLDEFMTVSLPISYPQNSIVSHRICVTFNVNKWKKKKKLLALIHPVCTYDVAMHCVHSFHVLHVNRIMVGNARFIPLIIANNRKLTGTQSKLLRFSSPFNAAQFDCY